VQSTPQHLKIRLSSCSRAACRLYSFFFSNDPATPEIYTLSLHDALPISRRDVLAEQSEQCGRQPGQPGKQREQGDAHQHRQCQADRKSTRLNSSHSQISYAVFCLKKKKKQHI